MTKPKRAASRADDWTFDMPGGLATHAPTTLQFRLEPMWGESFAPGRTEQLQAEGYRAAWRCDLPPEVKDRREAARIAPGDANAPGVTRWAILVHEEALQAAFDALAQQHGADQAGKMMPALAREAGERWIFRVRLERGWADGRRAT